MMRVVTWNVNSLRAGMERVEEWLGEVAARRRCACRRPKLADDAFPALTFEAMGYETAHYGQGQWNGVAILSRVGLDDVVTNFADGIEPDPDARIITATCGGIRITLLLRPQRPGARRRPLRRTSSSWLDRLRGPPRARHVTRRRRDRDRRLQHRSGGPGRPQPGEARRRHPRERARARSALDALCELGARRPLPSSPPRRRSRVLVVGLSGRRTSTRASACGSTWCSASPSVADRCSWSVVDRNARKGTSPSDHAPVAGRRGGSGTPTCSAPRSRQRGGDAGVEPAQRQASPVHVSRVQLLRGRGAVLGDRRQHPVGAHGVGQDAGGPRRRGPPVLERSNIIDRADRSRVASPAAGPPPRGSCW